MACNGMVTSMCSLGEGSSRPPVNPDTVQRQKGGREEAVKVRYQAPRTPCVCLSSVIW